MDVEGLDPQLAGALLRRAAAALSRAVGGPDLSCGPEVPGLEDTRGIFVTLHRDGALAGCIGYVEGVAPLRDLVERAARAAATEDDRFDPVRADELPRLRVEVSVLGPLQPSSADRFEPGVDGLLLRTPWTQGLLLPQVATEHRLGRAAFLDALARKARLAGLPALEALGDEAELWSFRVGRASASFPELQEIHDVGNST